jgi:hypothetical protein
MILKVIITHMKIKKSYLKAYHVPFYNLETDIFFELNRLMYIKVKNEILTSILFKLDLSVSNTFSKNYLTQLYIYINDKTFKIN